MKSLYRRSCVVKKGCEYCLELTELLGLLVVLKAGRDDLSYSSRASLQC